MGEEERAARSRRHRRAVSPQTPPHGVLHAGTVGHVRVFRYRAFEIVKRLQMGVIGAHPARRRTCPVVSIHERAAGGQIRTSGFGSGHPNLFGPVPCGAAHTLPGYRPAQFQPRPIFAARDLDPGMAPRPHARAGVRGGPGPPSCNGTDPTVFLNWEFAVPGHGKVGEQAVL